MLLYAVPAWITLLKVTVMTLVTDTSVAPSNGSTEITKGVSTISTFALAGTPSDVAVTVELPILGPAVKVVDAAPFTIVPVNGLTLPNASLEKVTPNPSGM